VQPCSIKITYEKAICKINFQNKRKNDKIFQNKIANAFAKFAGRIWPNDALMNIGAA
jgi:hypothetical protein